MANGGVLCLARMSSDFTILMRRRESRLGHFSLTDDGRILKDMLYSELATGTRPIGRPALRYKNVCEHDLIVGSVDPAKLGSSSV